ncbi:hypothetical protein K1T71_002730 [Dendrolimus kikuchii]|uniref:Uncharacterized protein n=1 Tax=Dendrolimus kikuchii TaxID=765133 RepID=A0ACC1DEE8_9NEOP|nr:hypothetical protein K1T71_002730 [Dendrolimus kikuchii]
MGQCVKGVGKNRWLLLRFKYVFILSTLLGSSLLILFIRTGTDILFYSNSQYTLLDSYRFGDSEAATTINTEGCTIPDLKPFDESVNKFIERPKNVKQCKDAGNSLLDNNDTHIWVVSRNLQHYDIPEEYNITCCYKSFYRPAAISDISSINVDDRVLYEKCIFFYDSIEVSHEFVRVSCTYKFKKVYQKLFLFARRKPFISYKGDIETSQNHSTYNVIVIGIDAISRLNFYRTMPKSLAYLKKKRAIELFGYNKLGDNTFPNVIPLLLGIKEADLKRACWPNTRASFDNCPFIWEWYKQAGYYTALGEDNARLGTFNLDKFGFTRTPTDYYIHTFMHEAEVLVGNNKDFNAYLCMGDKYFYKVLLDYIEGLASTLNPFRWFGFFWEVSMSHDYLNYPMLMDDNVETFLRNMDLKGHLNDTILILLSDHGLRWGDIRYTKQGRLEERLPLVHILLPDSFQEDYSLAYKNIKENAHKLTTPFDIHATLSDLINMDEVKDEQIKLRSQTSYASNKNISLFIPIPGNRTCQTAGIADHWCTCTKTAKMSVKSEEAQLAAAYLVRNLNMQLHEHRQCAKLRLVQILEATEIISGTPRNEEIGWQEFMVVVRTEPGDGVFEATLRRNTHEWILSGTVSRLNLYGDQSRCIHQYQLKLYCYCIQ